LFSRFFIDRPIFASVLSIIIVLAGALAIPMIPTALYPLPIAQYPEITPPTVEVSAQYPGANAKVLEDTVASPIEQAVNGVEGMLYMSSQCTNDGNYSCTITFSHGIDLNMAQVLVQNRVALAQPILPDLVKRKGVAVKKKSPSVMMIVNLYSPNGTRDSLYLSNYATIQIRDELARINGVGDITYIGQRDYSMRIWLDPQKMAARNLSTADVVTAIQQQNAQVAAGAIGSPPMPKGQVFQFSMTTLGRLAEASQFEDMILKSFDDRIVRLRDVANIELGALGYDQTCTMDMQASVALSIYQLPGTNAIKTAQAVRSKMEDLKDRFPEDVDYAIVYDTTPVIRESINEVFFTLRDAILLVAAVVLLFLQNWRSALIPLLAVPVAVVGTFAVMRMLGFSLNNLTLFGLVLAIGIVVDDAIVVVEAVEHHIEHGLTPRMATIKAMDEVSGPVIAVGLVLSAVFIPCAFISGLTGRFFQQFALTIAVSTVISAFNSLTLSPALAAILLKPRQKGKYDTLPRPAFALLGIWLGWRFLGPLLIELSYMATFDIEGLHHPWLLPTISAIALGVVGWFLGPLLNIGLGWSFRLFNQGFEWCTLQYTRAVGLSLRVAGLVLVGYAALVALTGWTFLEAPSGFIPSQDKGYLVVNVQLPDAASVERTRAVMAKIEKAALSTPGVRHTVAISGQSILLNANAPNYGAMYVMLRDFHERAKMGNLSADEIAKALQDKLRDQVDEGTINVFGAPPVDGLGTSGGFKLMVEDRANLGAKALQDVPEKMVENAKKADELEGLFTSYRAKTPWIHLDIDRAQARSMGVSTGEIFTTLQVSLGSLYVNDFNKFGRTWQVNVQAHENFRKQIDDLKQLQIRNDQGRMVPFSSIASFKEVYGPSTITRYNLYPASAVNGNSAPGYSSGQSIDRMEELIKKDLPPSMRYEWTELAYLQLQTGNTAYWVFLLAVVLVFLVLAAQYESWTLPLAVILVVPMCLLSSIAGVLIAQMDVNIFTQIGFIVLVGLASKNAILIVEFAKARREAGASAEEATLDACQLRLRPIIMTSLAFILGVVPLVLAEGAGAEMRRTLGTAVFAGMLGVTLFGIFLTPVFYYVIQWLADRVRPPERPRKDETRTEPLPEVILVGELASNVRHGA
jgi:multidrug efflux pump subunit AcrB